METPNHMQWVPTDGSLCHLPPHSSLCESRAVAWGLETEDCLLALIAEDRVTRLWPHQEEETGESVQGAGGV